MKIDLDTNEDLTQILPIQQKRTLAFVNHFVMDTVAHLNDLCSACESQLMEFNRKMEKLESALVILESQLASISSLDDSEESTSKKVDAVENKPEEVELNDASESITEQEEDRDVDVNSNQAKNDPRLVKFFKMLQFGVPEDAVKLKMRTEGLDPSLLAGKPDTLPEESSTTTGDN
ncbi:unnamed protein product [Phyllotreta striolata]|uniref:Uncharacterized protein n=1 Tax=Phyllotreta striolata TaxID=444603 RepID=A0A9N9TJ87_PHYSR|nr:unnamed protein product [Phyllotreta striolata]